MWWFKRAVLRPTFADVQAMHPWFLDYEQLEPGVRQLVWTLNQTDLVETLSSCEGHPELPDWWETTGGTAYVLCLVTSPDQWDQVLHRLRQLAQDWKGVQFIVQDDREQWEQWLGFQVSPAEPESARKALDQAISQTNELIKEYLNHDVVAITSARRGQEGHARQNGSHGLLEDEGKARGKDNRSTEVSHGRTDCILLSAAQDVRDSGTQCSDPEKWS